MKLAYALVAAALVACAVAHNEPHILDQINVKGITVDIDPSISLVVTPSQLTHTDWVTASWSGVSGASPLFDWIGVYSPSTANPLTTTVIKFKLTGTSESSGSTTFRLLNMRADYKLAFFRNGTNNPVLAAWSNVVTFANYNTPLLGHLAMTANAGEMRLTWTTRDVTAPFVQFGTVSGVYPQKAAAQTTTYSVKDMCGAPANSTGWRDPGLFNSAVMTGLTPGARYYYVFGDVYGLSAEYSFVAPPVVGPTQNFGFFCFGDLGQDELDGSNQKPQVMPASINTTGAMMADYTNQGLVLHIGDISYARGYAFQWDNFFDRIEPLATAMPWMSCPGNHERDWPNSGSVFTGTDSGGECGVAYERRVKMPAQPDKMWYSFDYASAHFVTMSTEHDFSVGSAQYQFLENDLANVNRTRTPWLFFSGHRPMYIDSTNNDEPAGDQPVARALRASIEPLLVKYQVDIAFWGHHHSYQRSCPVVGEKCASGDPSKGYVAPVHIVTGAGGAGNSQNIQIPQPSWIKFVNVWTHGYTRATVTPTSARFQYVSGLDRNVLDDYTLVKPAL